MKRYLILLVVLSSLLIVTTAFAANSYPWKSHAAPYDFLFGNHIDTHQQSKLIDGNKLGGFFYIKLGKHDEGTPKAMHGDCDKTPDDCIVGWKLKGVAAQATLLDKPEHGHPVWCVDAAAVPKSPGYSHFHWQGEPMHAGGLEPGKIYDGYLLKLTAIDTFYFEHHGGFLVTPGIDTATHANIVTDCD